MLFAYLRGAAHSLVLSSGFSFLKITAVGGSDSAAADILLISRAVSPTTTAAPPVFFLMGLRLAGFSLCSSFCSLRSYKACIYDDILFLVCLGPPPFPTKLKLRLWWHWIRISLTE